MEDTVVYVLWPPLQSHDFGLQMPLVAIDSDAPKRLAFENCLDLNGSAQFANENVGSCGIAVYDGPADEIDDCRRIAISPTSFSKVGLRLTSDL